MSLYPGPRRGEPEHNFNLMIISYGHSSGPLLVADNPNRVKSLYSVRDVPNPPNLLRKKHTGMSRRLQKEIILSKEGKARLTQILDNTESKMVDMMDEYSRAPTPEAVTEADLYAPKESPRELVVGIMCEEGRHRSVAVAEQLAKLVTKKPRWIVEVQHRDLVGLVESSEEDGDEEDAGTDGSVSPTLGRKSTKVAKQKDKEKKKMLGRKIGSLVDEEL
ncbi:MAG: hypothetical protein LQ341_001170 [Variospora aurantia]|nr:MAG: hypothetical protein LQ341_001170 [Variospora aurantia]